MSDEVITCVECGRVFIWSYSEQRYYKERHLSAPKRCPDCRARRHFDQAASNRQPVLPQTQTGSTRDRWDDAARAAQAQAMRDGPRSADPGVTGPAYSHTQRLPYPSWWANPVYRFAIITLGLAMLVTLLMKWSAPSLDIVFCWLFAITVVTVISYGYDKTVAGTEHTRVPERVLLLLTVAGGTLGAVGGMRYFGHKTAKVEFQRKFWLVLAVQIVVLIIWFVWLRPMLHQP